MDKNKRKSTYALLGFISLSIFIVSLFVDVLLKEAFDNRELLFRAIEVLTASSASFCLSVSFSINVSKKSNVSSIDGDNNSGNINPVNVDGQIVNVNINNGADIALREKIVKLSERMDKFEDNNIEKIADKVVEKMQGKQMNALDNDFIMKFVVEGRAISSDEIQDIWASLLVSNATTENKVTKRTLDIVKNLSVEEANIFESIAKLSFDGGVIYKKFTKSLPFIDISQMRDIGLLKDNDALSNTITIPPSNTISIKEGNLVIIFGNRSNVEKKISYDCHVLTSAGEQLKKSIGIEISEEKLIEFVRSVKEDNKDKNLSISVHRILNIESDGGIRYDPRDLSNQ